LLPNIFGKMNRFHEGFLTGPSPGFQGDGLTSVDYDLSYSHSMKCNRDDPGAIHMNALQRLKHPVETASCNILHPIAVRKVSKQMPSEETLNDLSEFFKVFADKTRIGILWALSFSEMCVCDLSMLLKVKQPAISQHLKTLRQMRLVKTRRDGKVVYYNLDDDHIHAMLNLGLNHIQEA
jgi:DNA-binding transcriptional ArsR family regulator